MQRLCIDMHTDMRAGTCTNMFAGMCIEVCVYSGVHRGVYGGVYSHAYDHWYTRVYVFQVWRMAACAICPPVQLEPQCSMSPVQHGPPSWTALC